MLQCLGHISWLPLTAESSSLVSYSRSSSSTWTWNMQLRYKAVGVFRTTAQKICKKLLRWRAFDFSRIANTPPERTNLDAIMPACIRQLSGAGSPKFQSLYCTEDLGCIW